MKIYQLQKTNSILNNFILEIRDVSTQKDKMRFRRNIERIGEIMALELSKTLSFSSKKVTTPLGTKTMDILDSEVVICSVLRAGLPLHQGFLNYFDNSENAFISAYRLHTNNDDTFEIICEYVAAPSIENKTLILVDPMLASGKSLVSVLKALEPYGVPKEIHIASVIASKTGVEFVSNHFPKNTNIWIAAMDELLNDKGYIIPGLGDAGDLAFGSKTDV